MEVHYMCYLYHTKANFQYIIFASWYLVTVSHRSYFNIDNYSKYSLFTCQFFWIVLDNYSSCILRFTDPLCLAFLNSS